MTALVVQTFVILLLAFLAGCVAGCFLAGRWGSTAAAVPRSADTAPATAAAPKRKSTASTSAARKSAPKNQARSAKTAPAKSRASRPARATASKRDDLKLLSGVGPVIEKKLHALGVTSFAQVAAWKKADIDRVDAELNFKGRIQREKWVSQAKTLAKGGDTAFSRKKRAGKSASKSA